MFTEGNKCIFQKESSTSV